MNKQVITLSVTGDNADAMGGFMQKFQELHADLFGSHYIEAATLSSYLIDESQVMVSDQESEHMTTFTVHKVLCQLGMTETEAHNAIMEIHKKGIDFIRRV